MDDFLVAPAFIGKPIFSKRIEFPVSTLKLPSPQIEMRDSHSRGQRTFYFKASPVPFPDAREMVVAQLLG
jgi:hypothetical protein